MEIIGHNWEPTALEMYQALVFVLKDTPPKKADALLVHAEPQDAYLDEKLLSVAVDAYKRKQIKTVVINGLPSDICHKKNIAYSGFVTYKNFLLKSGVLEEDIICTPHAFHTAHESQAFLSIAKEREWKNLIVCGHPYHQLRCFLQIIADMNYEQFYPNVYNLTHSGIPQNYCLLKTVFGGGKIDGTLSDHTNAEYERIVRYAQKPILQANGKMSHSRNATIPEMFEYLENRA